jgi:D-threonate/D-erythronate kinase
VNDRELTTLNYAIIADDLTGACDAAAPFAAEGISTWVTWELERPLCTTAQVIGVCTHSRACTREIAIKKARIGTKLVKSFRPSRVFMKIDSTLKGHWPEEIPAILDELQLSCAVVAPAFPSMGRKIVNARLHVDGVTDYQPLNISRLLSDKCSLPVAAITRDDLRRGTAHVLEFLQRGTHRIFHCDSENDRDLDTISEILEQLGNAVLPVGSRGLAASMARRSSLEARSLTCAPTATENLSPATPALSGVSWPVVVFAGSNNPITEAQIAASAHIELADMFDLNIANLQAVRDCLHCKRHIIVRVQMAEVSRRRVVDLLGICQTERISGLILTGGDTAHLICTNSGADGLWIEGEFMPGFSLARFDGGILNGISVATKAGGFGTPNTLIQLVQKIIDVAVSKLNTAVRR